MKLRPNPLWFWNNTAVTVPELEAQMQNFRDRDGYGGLSILPFGRNFKPEYLTEEYFEVYGAALEKASQLGLTMWMYDEYGFPSGGIGLINGDGCGRFKEKFPDQTIKRLDKVEFRAESRDTLRCSVPEGTLMAAVAMENLSKRRIDLARHLNDAELEWIAPTGDWKVMLFMCRDAEDIVDYLDDDASRRFVEMTHEKYLERFKPYFGSTLIGTFFDEPTLYRADGRCWTPRFNEKFERRFGHTPALYYPALWYDIGDETTEALNRLFGFRSDLYAEGFTKVVGDWSRQHGLFATGHQDNEEIVNPVGTSGDLMKCFKYLEIPGIDKIGGNRPAELFYKVVSSAAYNWDRSLVMSETYGAMGDIEWEKIYSIAMDQYSKGINLLIPHAVWYDTGQVSFKPELSYRNPKYSPRLKEFNDYLTRLNVLLQNDGRFVADVAVIYPIETMQAGHYFDGPLKPYDGGVRLDGTDYVEVARTLSDDLGIDFLFLHPEAMAGKCSPEKGVLRLKNNVQHGSYGTLIFPSCQTLSLDNLRKAWKMYRKGGTVIFTTRMPENGIRLDENRKVARLAARFFPPNRTDRTVHGIQCADRRGGRAVFIEKPGPASLAHALVFAGYDGDVTFSGDIPALRHIHKIVDRMNVWFFANPSPDPVETEVSFKGAFTLSEWNPHTGRIEENAWKETANGRTAARITLDPFASVFLVETVPAE